MMHGQQNVKLNVEVNYWNKLKVNSASCWFLLYGYITMHGQQNIKFPKIFFMGSVVEVALEQILLWSLPIDILPVIYSFVMRASYNRPSLCSILSDHAFSHILQHKTILKSCILRVC